MKPFEKWLLLGGAATTALTGVAYAWMRYLLEPVDPWAVIHHPLEPWVLKAHILVAPILVFAAGTIAVAHVWRHVRARVRAGRGSGLLTAGVFLPMVASGYLLQAVTSPVGTRWLVAIHLGTGALFTAGLALHLVRSAGRRTSRGGRRNPASGRRGIDRGSAPRLPLGERAR